MKIKLIIINLFAGVLLIPLSQAFPGDYGTAPVFEAGAGARPAAMGNAFTAVADDSSAIYYNPAGLSLIKAQELSLLYYQLYEGALYNSAAYGQTLLDFGTLGAAFYLYSAGTISGYDSNDKKTGDFAFREYKAVVSYAAHIEKVLRLGVAVNVINSAMGKENSTGIGADAGLLYEPFDFLRLGFMARNLFRPVQSLGTENEGMPQVYTLGILLKQAFGAVNVNISGDFSAGESENFRARAGLELVLYDTLSLRAGYDSGRYSIGAGLDLFNVRADYAYIAVNYLENLQRIGISYRFGMSLDEQRERKKSEIMNQVRKIVEERLRSKEKKNAMKHYAAAYEYYRNGSYENALNEANRALEWREDTKEAIIMKNTIAKVYYGEAIKQYKEGNYIGALESFNDALAANPSLDGPEGYIAEINTKLRIKEETKSDFNEGIRLYSAKDYGAAIKAWEKALLVDPANQNVKICLAAARRRLNTGKTGTAIPAAQAEAAKKLYYEGINAYTAGDVEKAAVIWEQALKLNPDDVKSARGIEKAGMELEEYKKRGLK
ncbi:MAG: PorV/PorQ family protein [Spirochaetia bacterium]|nr:PorV/PorQ family protein [Spirochaetia bacterium]